MNIAYFINQYPKVSHSFIRREILALEERGFQVVRMALRGWDAPQVDAADKAELERTHYLLRHGLAGLLLPFLRRLLRSPSAMLRALSAAVRMSRMSERPVPYHLIYCAEACALLEHLEKHPVAHIHAHFGTNSAEVVTLARLLGGPPFSFTVHGPDEFDRPEALHLAQKVQASAFVVAISSYGRSQLYRWIGHPHWNKVQVVHCGLDAAFLAPPPVGTYPVKDRLVCVGRLCEQKGQLLLLDAVRRLKDRGRRVELVLAGDGEMRAELESAIGTMGLQDDVRITGWISGQQVREELLAAKAMVLPSFAEGLPVVVMEAMALQRVVVSTRIAGIPELVRHGVDGWLVTPGDVEALVSGLTELLDTPADRLAAMGSVARQRVVERHDARIEAGKLADLFRQPRSGQGG
jgi:colanic acid/amylovoran biosynthesis glycosyltransferase